MPVLNWPITIVLCLQGHAHFLGILFQHAEGSSKIVVGFVWHMCNQLVLLQALLRCVLMANLKGLIARRPVMQCLEAHIRHVSVTNPLRDALSLQQTPQVRTPSPSRTNLHARTPTAHCML